MSALLPIGRNFCLLAASVTSLGFYLELLRVRFYPDSDRSKIFQKRWRGGGCGWRGRGWGWGPTIGVGVGLAAASPLGAHGAGAVRVGVMPAGTMDAQAGVGFGRVGVGDSYP
jgi:hypothetical protein